MRIPAVLMRGGTSRGLFFHENDLPADAAERDRVILGAFGSPDPYRRQIDGAGGATSNTSKVAVIGSSTDPDVDVTYTFGQVGIDRPLIDWTGNCGNISSAVGPFAVDEGLVKAPGSETRVRFLNTNTNKIIDAHVPTRDGRFDPTGDLVIAGIPGTGAAIRMDYRNPAGAVTGQLLPTGRLTDTLRVSQRDIPIAVSIVDAANPLVFIRFADVGLSGTEPIDELDADQKLLEHLQAIRCAAGVLAGIAGSAGEIASDYPSVPKVALVGPPIDYIAADGSAIAATETSVRLTMLSMGRPHPAVALTGAICTAVAAKLPGTIVHAAAQQPRSDEVTRIGHPAGVLTVTAEPTSIGRQWVVDSVAVYRTARRIFEGAVFVPTSQT